MPSSQLEDSLEPPAAGHLHTIYVQYDKEQYYVEPTLSFSGSGPEGANITAEFERII